MSTANVSILAIYGVIWAVAAIAAFIWMGFALGALLRKLGATSAHAWVPVLRWVAAARAARMSAVPVAIARSVGLMGVLVYLAGVVALLSSAPDVPAYARGLLVGGAIAALLGSLVGWALWIYGAGTIEMRLRAPAALSWLAAVSPPIWASVMGWGKYGVPPGAMAVAPADARAGNAAPAPDPHGAQPEPQNDAGFAPDVEPVATPLPSRVERPPRYGAAAWGSVQSSPSAPSAPSPSPAAAPVAPPHDAPRVEPTPATGPISTGRIPTGPSSSDPRPSAPSAAAPAGGWETPAPSEAARDEAASAPSAPPPSLPGPPAPASAPLTARPDSERSGTADIDSEDGDERDGDAHPPASTAPYEGPVSPYLGAATTDAIPVRDVEPPAPPASAPATPESSMPSGVEPAVEAAPEPAPEPTSAPGLAPAGDQATSAASAPTPSSPTEADTWEPWAAGAPLAPPPIPASVEGRSHRRRPATPECVDARGGGRWALSAAGGPRGDRTRDQHACAGSARHRRCDPHHVQGARGAHVRCRRMERA